VYGYIFVRRRAREAWRWLQWRFLTVRLYNTQFQRIPTVRAIRRILSGFCAEAAVLIAIFPYLDFLIENYRSSGVRPVDMGPVKHVSVILCLACLASAIILAIKTDEQE
jgi:hypothetical protein